MSMQGRLVTAYMDEGAGQAKSILMEVFGLLRAQHLMMWNHHWEAAGVGAYGVHLLFERIYGDDGLVQDVDGLAEKLMGYFGPDAVKASATLAIALRWVQHWEQAVPDCIVTRSLRSEKELQKVLQGAYNAVKGLGAMTLGLDDFIMELASRHETNIYLFQQLLEDPQGMTQKLAASELSDAHLFFDNPQKREVREFADSRAITNDIGVALKQTEEPRAEAVAKAQQAPPTVSDNLALPGADEFSTLNRFVIETAEPVKGVPEGYHEIGKHPVLASDEDLFQQYWQI